MAEQQQAKHSASTESFEHVALDDGAQAADAGAAPAAAAAAEPSAPAEEAAAPAAAAPAAAPAAAAAPATIVVEEADADESLPPATQALNSVLSFFGAGSVPSPGQRQQQPAAAPAEQQAAAQAAAEEEEGEEAGEDPVAAFEREAAELAQQAQHAAEEVGQKLLHGAAEAKESLASLAQGFSSWWSSKPGDAAAKEAGGSGSARQQAGSLSADAASLGLDSGETVLESFACSLLQTYTATSNFYTPPKQLEFPGSLHVTSSRLGFVFGEPGLAPVKLQAKALRAVAKLPADAAKGLPERLEVQLAAKGQSLVFCAFALAQLELDSALALLEHLAAEGAEQ